MKSELRSYSSNISQMRRLCRYSFVIAKHLFHLHTQYNVYFNKKRLKFFVYYYLADSHDFTGIHIYYIYIKTEHAGIGGKSATTTAKERWNDVHMMFNTIIASYLSLHEVKLEARIK